METWNPSSSLSALDGLTTCEEVATARLVPGKTTAAAIRRAARLGQLPTGAVVRLGRRVYLRKAILERWLRGEEAC